jgi:ketosteroid isomerase-like protein
MTEQTPQEADAEWYRAVIARDQDLAIDYIDDDYNLVVLYPTFARVTRTEWLAMLPDYVVSGWDVVSSDWDVQGDLAVHTHHINMEAIVMGGDRSGPFTITDVWRRIDGRWRVWRRVSTPLQSADMPRLDPRGS